MNLFVALTDYDWYRFLSAKPAWDEVNFWQPGGSRLFRALLPGELLVFKLHAPYNAIVGGGFFAHSMLLPLSTTWEFFGQANGVAAYADMRNRVARYRTGKTLRHDHQIGTIVLLKPFFLPESLWIDAPRDWKPQIVQGKTYSALEGVGKEVFDALSSAGLAEQASLLIERVPAKDKYGKLQLVRGRLGQGAFRALVTDVYDRRCAVTSERTLPALEAAHIRPYADGGEHWIDNGLLLRRDLHALFDQGYVTVTPEYRVEVSNRIKEEFHNGSEYYKLRGGQLALPSAPNSWPATECLTWHNDNKYLG